MDMDLGESAPLDKTRCSSNGKEPGWRKTCITSRSLFWPSFGWLILSLCRPAVHETKKQKNTIKGKRNTKCTTAPSHPEFPFWKSRRAGNKHSIHSLSLRFSLTHTNHHHHHCQDHHQHHCQDHHHCQNQHHQHHHYHHWQDWRPIIIEGTCLLPKLSYKTIDREENTLFDTTLSENQCSFSAI